MTQLAIPRSAAKSRDVGPLTKFLQVRRLLPRLEPLDELQHEIRLRAVATYEVRDAHVPVSDRL